MIAYSPQPVRRRPVLPACDQHLAVRINMEIVSWSAALTRLLQSTRSDRCRKSGFLRWASARKSQVAIDPEQGFFGIAMRDSGIEARNVTDQPRDQLQQFGTQNVVARFVHQEPRAIIVLFKLAKELDQVTKMHGARQFPSFAFLQPRLFHARTAAYR